MAAQKDGQFRFETKLTTPLGGNFDEVAEAMVTPATSLSNKNKALSVASGQTPATPIQLKLDLGIEVERVVGGIEMGVLENGIPYPLLRSSWTTRTRKVS
ncbi:MAG: hypothetical protein F8N39_17100 [Clostridiaceae bacterium]|nr:hypothetical protein [Clostridiaceae bacterium]